MARKRGNGEGTIYKLKNGNFRSQVTVRGGKRLSFTAKTRKEVSDWIRKTNQQVEQGLTYQAGKVKLGEYLERWLASKENALRPATYQHYRILAEKHLIPKFGELTVKELTPDHIQFVYDEWARRGVGSPTIKKAHAVLHQALARATHTGLLLRNPAGMVNPPKSPEKEMLYWTEEQVNRFLSVAQGNRLYALFYLAIVTGARQMEILGLQWRDLDWNRGTLRIQRQLARKSGELFAPIKTKAGKRTLELGSSTLAVLHNHLEQQQMEWSNAGDAWQNFDLIFTSIVGTPVHHKNLVDRYFKPLVRAANVPPIRYHDLRHTAVAIMLSNGVPIFTASKIIGHARPSITSDTYGHLIPGAASGIGQLMDDLVAPVSVDLPVAPGCTRVAPANITPQ
jgi:integrase